MNADVSESARYPFDPNPAPGLGSEHFRPVALRGFGDPLNAYPHSMVWFNDRLFVGTTRANLCMLRVSKIPTSLGPWPVDCPDHLYQLDMRAQIWSYDPLTDAAELRFRSPVVQGSSDDTQIPRDMGYRGMVVFQGESDPVPALYVSTYASVKGPGPLVLRSLDGYEFSQVCKYGLVGLPITTIRSLVSFKGRLFTAPTGRAGGSPNIADLPLIYCSRDPAKGSWDLANEPGFGDTENLVIFEMIASGDYLYAGTGNLSGFQIWRTPAEGTPPYEWEKVMTRGAYRGSLNQGVVSFLSSGGDIYIGTGIQNGGIDLYHGVGPAPPELLCLHEDLKWDLIAGRARMTPQGRKDPLSGYGPGFDNVFNGYIWRMACHDGWMYAGTFDWSLMLRYADQKRWPPWFKRLIARVGMDKVVASRAGADLYRSCDGENWIPVTTNGFDNPYNYGIRSFADSPYGLFVGTVNPFGPRVNVPTGDGWEYKDNARGGLEIWLGSREHPREIQPDLSDAVDAHNVSVSGCAEDPPQPRRTDSGP